MDKKFDANFIILSCQYSTGTFDYCFCNTKQELKKEDGKMRNEDFTIMAVLELVEVKDLTKEYM